MTTYELRLMDWISDVFSSDLSQVFPELSPRRLRHGPERQQLHAVVGHPLDAQDIAGQRLPRDQRAQVAGEVVRLGGAAGFLVQVAKVELPAVCLLAAVLAHQAVQPTDRKSVVSGKSVEVRVDIGGGRCIKKK